MRKPMRWLSDRTRERYSSAVGASVAPNSSSMAALQPLMPRRGERRSCETEYEKDSSSALAPSSCDVRRLTRSSSSALRAR